MKTSWRKSNRVLCLLIALLFVVLLCIIGAILIFKYPDIFYRNYIVNVYPLLQSLNTTFQFNIRCDLLTDSVFIRDLLKHCDINSFVATPTLSPDEYCISSPYVSGIITCKNQFISNNFYYKVDLSWNRVVFGFSS
jgi:hypothetical protein